MKQTLFLLTILTCLDTASQEKETKFFQFNLTLDTLVSPDFYDVKISVAESVSYIKEKKHYYAHITPLDSLEAALTGYLGKMGFASNLQRSLITEVQQGNMYSRSEKKLFEVSYFFNVKTQDSVEMLFKNLDRNMISGIIITPNLEKQTQERIRDMLTISGIARSKQYATQMAQQNNQQIIGSKYNIMFYDGGPMFDNIYNLYDTKFKIVLGKVKYRFGVNYTYYFSGN